MADVKVPVCYLIYTDGVYTNSREAARAVLIKNIFSKYSYFSKVEWSFFSASQFSMTVYPDREETIKASKRLLAVILPRLEKEHWPDWER